MCLSAAGRARIGDQHSGKREKVGGKLEDINDVLDCTLGVMTQLGKSQMVFYQIFTGVPGR